MSGYPEIEKYIVYAYFGENVCTFLIALTCAYNIGICEFWQKFRPMHSCCRLDWWKTSTISLLVIFWQSVGLVWDACQSLQLFIRLFVIYIIFIVWDYVIVLFILFCFFFNDSMSWFSNEFGWIIKMLNKLLFSITMKD